MRHLRASVVFAFAILLSLPTLAAESTRQRAGTLYLQAKQLYDDLHAVPKPELGTQQYALVIEAFEKVHRMDPASGHVDDALYFAAKVREEMAEHFGGDGNRQRAIQAYRYMAQQYPHSKLAVVAKKAAADLEAGASASKPAPVEMLDRDEPVDLSQSSTPPPAPSPPAAAAASPPPVVAVVNRIPESNKSARSGPAEVRDVRFWSHNNYTRIVIEVEDRVEFKYDRLAQPPRIYFDLYDTKIGGNLLKSAEFEVNDSLVKQIRVGQNRRTISRVVFDLATEPYFEVMWLSNPARFVIEMRTSKEPIQVAEATTIPTPTPISPADRLFGKLAPVESSEPLESVTPQAPPPLAENPPPTPPRQVARVEIPPEALSPQPPKISAPEKAAVNPPSPKQADANTSGKRGLIRAMGLKMGKVVIDAGHGGHDTGSIGPSGLREKDVVVDIAQRLGRLIEDQLGAEVIYTRKGDNFIPIKNRTRMANDSQADLFISVHANASRSRSVRGIETFYLNLTSDSWAMSVASRENAASDHSIHEMQSLLQKIAQNETLDESREFATRIQKSMHSGAASEISGLRDRGVRKAPLLVLMGAKMPAILAEIGFISNSSDEKMLKTSKYRQQMAGYLFNGIAEYAQSLGMVSLAQTEEASDPGLD